MKKFISYFLVLFFSCFSFAEIPANQQFDFIKASQAANQIEQFKGVVSSSSTDRNRCVPLQGSHGEGVMSCQVSEEEIDHNVIVKTPEFSEGKIPEAIKNVLPAEFVHDVEKKKVSCVFNFRMVNDNQQMLGCKGTLEGSNGTVMQGEKCGDDWGNTHGLNVGISCISADGLSQTFTYSTDLFSDPNRASFWKDENGIPHMDQKFVSENIFLYIQDNVNKGKLSYWRRGVGFINLSTKKKWGLLQSTGQQEWYHNYRNRAHPGEAMDYNYIEGDADKWGAFVTLATGLQASKELGSFCKVSSSVELGARLSTLKQSNLIYGGANTKFGVKVGEGQIYARAGYDLTRRSSSTIGETTLAVGYERKSGTKLEVGMKSQTGNRKDVPDTPNLVAEQFRGVKKNDKLVYMEFSYGF